MRIDVRDGNIFSTSANKSGPHIPILWYINTRQFHYYTSNQRIKPFYELS